MILHPLGDRAFLAVFFRESEAVAWASAVRERALPEVADVVVAYEKVAVFAGPDALDLDALEGALRSIRAIEGAPDASRLLVVPVLYDGEDLAFVAEALGLSIDDVIACHQATEYVVQAIGFLPGFPYAGALPDTLRGLARRASPRVRVPAGSVAIAGRQTCIYPRESPGGWHLLGRTPCSIVDLEAGHFACAVGDRLRFERIDRDASEAMRGRRLVALADAGTARDRVV